MKLDTQVAPGDGIQQTSRPRRRISRKMRVVLGITAVLIVVLGVSGGYLLLMPHVQPLKLPAVPAHLSAEALGLAGYQNYSQPAPADPLHDASLPPDPRVDANLAAIEDAAGLAYIQQGDRTRGFAYLKAAAQSQPDNLRYANDYRIALRDHQQYQQEETFFTQLQKTHASVNVQISLALSYVDEMRSCPKPPDGLVCQAQYSSRSISVLDKVLQGHQYNIIARYARGLNHLYWPTLMGHLPQAQVDLQYTVALCAPLNALLANALLPDAYAALGDVIAKDGKVSDARNVWLNGKQLVPGPSILDQRLSIASNQLVNEENNALRGLGVYVDTNITLFWQRGRK